MTTTMKITFIRRLVTAIVLLLPLCAFTQDEQATIKLSFPIVDSVKTCKATVYAGDKPVKGVDVKFYAKRFYSLLPLGAAVTTDDDGAASINFPKDLPGGTTGMIVIIAKIEDDETYGTLETKDSVKWGTIVSSNDVSWNQRSLSASREKAPMYLIVASNVIILGIWGTLVFIVLQLVRIKKASGQRSLKGNK